jgi:hypothetical protein
VHRLDRINAKKPAKLLGSNSLTLGFRVKQIWPVCLCFSSTGHDSAHYRRQADFPVLIAVGALATWRASLTLRLA